MKAVCDTKWYQQMEAELLAQEWDLSIKFKAEC